MRLKWHRRALLNLDQIHNYIMERDPAAANRVAHRIEEAALMLKQFPQLGRPSHNTELRLLQVPDLPYLLPYTVNRDHVEILAVFDERQERPDQWS